MSVFVLILEKKLFYSLIEKETDNFFCMNCPRAETALFLPEKIACPLF